MMPMNVRSFVVGALIGCFVAIVATQIAAVFAPVVGDLSNLVALGGMLLTLLAPSPLHWPGADKGEQ